jgi:hypothetical protein
MTRGWNAENPVSWKEHLFIALILGILLIAWHAWAGIGANETDRFLNRERTASGGYVRREKKPPLSPARYVGQTARAYQIAHEIPDILDQLYCYCECDKHLGHKSLLSCFTDDHGAG